MAAGKEGQINLSLSAWANRGVEICDNQIDDDGDNLVTAMTRIARGSANCQAPMCLPDSDLGDFDIGTRKTLNVDLTNATRTFSTKCGQGHWVWSIIYRLSVLNPMDLWSSARIPAIRSYR